MKVLNWILIVIAAIIAAALITAIFLPKEVTVSSSTEINKPLPQVFHSMAMFTERQDWDPWISEDTTTKVTINAKEGYVGSTYEWEGESVGTGKMEVASVEYPNQITSYLWFGNQPDTSVITWKLNGEGNSTDITWEFLADAPYPVGRLFMNLMKGGLKRDFEKGLGQLKEYLEGKDTHLSTLSEITETQIAEKVAMVCKTSGPMNEIIIQMENMFNGAMKAIEEQNLQITGSPFAYYTDYNPEDETTTMYCGLPVGEAGQPTEKVAAVTFPASNAIMAVHTGPYEEFERSYNKMMEYVEKNGIPVNWNAMEVYVNDPMKVKFPTLYKTEIYFEVKE